jgi:hypothetical protein
VGRILEGWLDICWVWKAGVKEEGKGVLGHCCRLPIIRLQNSEIIVKAVSST